MAMYNVTTTLEQEAALQAWVTKFNNGLPTREQITPAQAIQSRGIDWLNNLIRDTKIQQNQDFRGRYERALVLTRQQVDTLLGN